MSETTRRAVLAGAAGISAAVTLAACTRKEDEPTADPGGAASSAASTAATGAAGALADLAQIPVGGGRIFADQKVVVTQPTAGQVKAFSITCTHQGCPVSEVANGTINCNCHGSKFKIADGSVATGPATRPLAPASVKLENGKIVLG